MGDGLPVAERSGCINVSGLGSVRPAKAPLRGVVTWSGQHGGKGGVFLAHP